MLPLESYRDAGESASVVDYWVEPGSVAGSCRIDASVRLGEGRPGRIVGEGNGVISAFVAALEHGLGTAIEVSEYAQQTLSEGTDAVAVTYVWIRAADQTAWGIAEHTDTAAANLNAILAALVRIPGCAEGLGAIGDPGAARPKA